MKLTAYRHHRMGIELIGNGTVQLMRNVEKRRQLAQLLHLVKPFPAAGIRVGRLQQPVFPIMKIVQFHAVAVTVTHHYIIRPITIKQINFRLQCHHVASGLVVGRSFQLSVVKQVFPPHFHMFRRSWLEPANTWHAEIGRHRNTFQADNMIKLLHAGEIPIEHILVSHRIFERETRLYAVERRMIFRQVTDKVHAHLCEQIP